MKRVLVAGLLTALSACAPDRLPEDSIRRNNEAVGQMGRYEYGAAEAIFAELAAAHPEQALFRFNRAVAVMNRQQDGDEALATAMFAELADADYCRGLLAFRAGDVVGARRFFEQERGRDPDDAHLRYFLGQTLQQADEADAALAEYQAALQLDPLLRSAHYAAGLLSKRLGDETASRAALEQFQALARHPQARLAEFKYTRMGRRCEARAWPVVAPESELPTGDWFAAPVTITRLDPVPAWAEFSAADVDADGQSEALLSTPGGHRLFRQDTPGHWVEFEHPLSAARPARSVAFADLDNDGGLDAVFAGEHGIQVWKREGEQWREAAAEAGLAEVHGASQVQIFDTDHDGDLDLYLRRAAAGNLWLANLGTGRFQAVPEGEALAGNAAGNRLMRAFDLDADRDRDVLIVDHRGVGTIRINERLWRYRDPVPLFPDAAPLRDVAVIDHEVDGRAELLSLDERGALSWWHQAESGWMSRATISVDGVASSLLMQDLDGDGRAEAMVHTERGLFGVGLRGQEFDSPRPIYAGALRAAELVLAHAGKGPGLMAIDAEGRVLWLAPGPGRWPFVSVLPSGYQDGAAAMRSNRSGIGTQLWASRVGAASAIDFMPQNLGAGQSLQPVSIGLGGDSQIDHLRLLWPDGVLQSEVGLKPGAVHALVETERQLSSCPVLFAWDGQGHRFITDLIGVGGMGYLVEPGVYAPPRPWEFLLLDDQQLKSREGRFELKLGEPMEEAAYIDSMRLQVLDVRDDFTPFLDERMGIQDPQPTGATHFSQRDLMPIVARSARGDETAALAAADQVAVDPGALDPRFIGLLREANWIELEFDQDLSLLPDLALRAHGWIEYPYSQTMFAAWQAGVSFEAPSLDARDGEGRWHRVLSQFGYPAGMPRAMSLPLPRLPAGTRALRLSSNQEIYWDQISVALVAQPPPDAVRRFEARLASARVQEVGFARRSTGRQRQPHYDYAKRAPLWDTAHQAGDYTQFGEALPLLERSDAALAIFGPGEEIHLEFADELPALPAGWRRWYVLETRGWVKDRDLFTGNGDTLAPLPGREQQSAAAADLERRFNTRYQDGP